jgi:DNA primase
MPFVKENLPNPHQFWGEQGLEKYKVVKDKATACCPFHKERSPSFTIWLEDGHFKCFGCGQAGDIISYQRFVYSQTFVEACKALGAWA